MTEQQARHLSIGDCVINGHGERGTVQSIGYRDGYVVIYWEPTATTHQSYRAPYDMTDISLQEDSI